METEARQPLERAFPYLLAGLLGLGVAYLNLHTDEVPFVALPVVAAAFLLGLLSPRRAWLWALLVGLWVPGSQLVALALGWRLPYPNNLAAIPAPLIAGLLFALLGAYAGAGVRWLTERSFRAE